MFFYHTIFIKIFIPLLLFLINHSTSVKHYFEHSIPKTDHHRLTGQLNFKNHLKYIFFFQNSKLTVRKNSLGKDYDEGFEITNDSHLTIT